MLNTTEILKIIYTSDMFGAIVLGFFASFMICIVLVLTKRWHGSISMDHTDGIQKFHTTPTPRIGGVPIFVALVVACANASEDVNFMLMQLLLAGLPAFLFGVAEDITKRVGVTQRLLATIASGVLAWWITNYSLSRVDVWGLDWLMQYTFVSVVFTAIAVGGVANAINIIDGLNGLASSMVFWAMLGLAGVAVSVGDVVLAQSCLMVVVCVAGFFLVNWPLGKIFLGDGGSYFLGFSLAWSCVLLIERNSDVTAFAALLLCFHPITEVLFSIWRRRQRLQNPGHPDRLHFHSLFKRRVMPRIFPKRTKHYRNSAGGLLVGSISILPALLVQFVYHSPIVAAMSVVLLVSGYVYIYRRLVGL